MLLAGVLLAAVLVGVALSVSQAARGVSAVPPATDLPVLNERSLVYDADGDVLAVLHAEQNRSPVELDQVPQPVVDTIIASEDADFYEHHGLDLSSTLRALFDNVEAGEVEQGGSTITQQLVKGSLLSAEQTLDRKVREAVLSVQLEHELSKDQILERYLNQVYFGGGAYGVQAAAETYWGVDVEDLGWAEAATLASLIRNPVRYDPISRPDVAREHRRAVLDRVVDAGNLTEDEADELAEAPLPESRHEVLPLPDQYFARQVVDRLLDDARLGATPAERYHAVFQGGLRIHTTHDPAAQALAEQAVAEHVPDTGGRFTAAVVAVDPATGGVRALVGGPGLDRWQYDLAVQGLRQPGSAFKVVVLAAALEAGLVAEDRIDGSGPCTIPNPGGTPDPYVADNYTDGSGGYGTLRSQTTRSSNCAFLRLGQEVGLDQVVQVARDLGITTPLDPAAPSLAIGSFEVHPLEMASVAATVAAGGVRRSPHLVDRVEDRDGSTIWEAEVGGERVLAESTACGLQQVLEANVRSGTGTAAGIDRPAAGKTGTTQDHADAWFVGFTPQLAAAVWMGAPEGRVPMEGVGGRAGVTGGSFPAEVWGAFMGGYHAFRPAEGLCRDPAPRPGRSLGGPSSSGSAEDGRDPAELAGAAPATGGARAEPGPAPSSASPAPGVQLTCAPGYQAFVDRERGLYGCTPVP